MRIRRLQTRFIAAGGLLALLTVAVGFGSAWTFNRLGRVVDRTLREGREPIDLAAALADSLEREDDAVFRDMNGEEEQAGREVAEERRRGDAAFERLRARFAAEGGGAAAILEDLRRTIDAYRRAASDLMAGPPPTGALGIYRDRVNPLLQRAVRGCGAIRERYFDAMRSASLRARDDAMAATGVVVAASMAALALATVVAIWLARSVGRPIGMLSDSMEALRQGDFGRRVVLEAHDELGNLAAGFNRMAEALAEYRRSSLDELLAAKRTLESTLDALPDAVLVIAPDGGLAGLNPPARAILESKRLADARRVEDLPLAPEHRETIEAALAGRPGPSARADFTRVIEVRLDGRPRKFLVTAAPIPDFAPRGTGAVVVLHDVTEFARLDELRSELVAVASHELKTPLTTLRMNVMLLGETAGAFTGRQRAMLDAALSACEELGGTIDELLDMTRIEAGQLRLDMVPVDLNALVDAVTRPLRPRFDDADVRLDVRREARPAVVVGDPSRLRTVLNNLLSNALKYSPPGRTVAVRIASRQGAGPADPATRQIAVTDAGPGIPEAFRDRVFEKFFRVEHHVDVAPKGIPGTGIGLYLCREIVKAHGGSLWCEPGDGGVGTTFALRLRAGA
jgi:NtrC-family two-component system sensor histidine kinase KinB